MVGLMMIISGAAYSGAKEYTIRICKNVTNHSNCNDTCKVVGKINFKISKSQDSVMKNMIFDTGQIESMVEGNCKIFDEETFECKDSSDGDISGIKIKLRTRLMLSNGKWIMKDYLDNQAYHGVPSNTNITGLSCGEEIN